jgi:aldehyde dehydrogenase (NAD+)
MRGNEANISSQEIFGPIIPIVSYSTDEDLDNLLYRVGNPLALYIFSKKKKFISKIKSTTSSGAVCVNDIGAQFINHNLPFGGVMSSGAGRYHGFSGFKEFSNSRSIMIQSRINFLNMLSPPYSKISQKMVDVLIWFYKKI